MVKRQHQWRHHILICIQIKWHINEIKVLVLFAKCQWPNELNQGALNLWDECKIATVSKYW